MSTVPLNLPPLTDPRLLSLMGSPKVVTPQGPTQPLPIPAGTAISALNPGPAPTLAALPQAQSNPLSALGAPDMPQVVAPPGTIQGDMANLQRLTAGGSGIHQIFNPVDDNGNPTNQPVSAWRKLGGIGATIGDTLLRIAAPKLEAMIPGTEGNQQYELGKARQIVTNDEANSQGQANIGQTQANTLNLDLQPQLKLMTAENTYQKTQGQIDHWNAQNQNYQDRLKAGMREHGLTVDETDPTGEKLRPLKYDEMTPLQQQKFDVETTQQEVGEAQAALKKAQAANIPINIQLAMGRLAVARQNANTAVTRILGKPVQVQDPNDPNNTVFETAANAIGSGAHGTAGIGFQAQKGLQKDFTSGTDAHTLTAINTADHHLESLGAAATALQNGDLPMLNRLANQYGVASGSSAPLVFDTLKTALTGELGKAFSGGAATVSEQENISHSINNANSPRQLADVANANRQLMKGKRDALINQYQQGLQGHPAFNNAPVGPPPGATHIVPGSDNRMHYTDGKNDLGVAP
jgi:hypothetical protein